MKVKSMGISSGAGEKKDGSLRFCIDLRKLNSRTVKDAYSLTRIDETLDCLNGASGSHHWISNQGTGRLRWMRKARH